MLTQIQSKAIRAMENAILHNRNLVVESTAGSGKTFTIAQFTRQFSGFSKIAIMAFNKNAANELEARCKPVHFIGTLHSKGMRNMRRKAYPKNANFWHAASITGYRYKVESKENSIAQFVASNATALSDKMKEELSDDVAMLLEKYASQIATTLYKVDYSGEIVQIARDIVATTCKRIKATGKIDFVDMLYYPLQMGYVDKYDVVIVDEAQDLTPLKLAFVREVLQPKTLILVGDDNQAINLWAGAISSLLANSGYDSVRLNVTHRNGHGACSMIQTRFNIDHVPGDNVVTDDCLLTVDNPMAIVDAMPYGLILSRTNADLVPLWHSLIKAGQNAKICNDKSEVARLKAAIANYNDIVARGDGDSDIMDTAAKILELASGSTEAALTMLANMTALANDNGYLLSTVHKQKGATFDHVALLDNLQGEGDTLEERNIRFVANTRQKYTLIQVKAAQ